MADVIKSKLDFAGKEAGAADPVKNMAPLWSRNDGEKKKCGPQSREVPVLGGRKKTLGVLNKQQNFQEEEKEREKFPTYVSDPLLSPVDLRQPLHVLLAHDWNEILEGFHFFREVS